MLVLQRRLQESCICQPTKHRKKYVPTAFVSMLAEVALGKCIVPPRKVTRFNAIPFVESLPQNSTPTKKQIIEIIISHPLNRKFCLNLILHHVRIVITDQNQCRNQENKNMYTTIISAAESQPPVLDSSASATTIELIFRLLKKTRLYSCTTVFM